MPEHHTRQNQFTGHAGRHKSTIPKGGEQTVHRSIGGAGCWCGQEYGHDWPGKADGKPHPKGIDMNQHVTQPDRIAAKDLRGWHKDVVDLIRELINDYGVRYRAAGKGGNSLLLYPKDGTSQPFRVSMQRPHDQTVRYLLGFAREFVPGFRADEEADVTKAVQRLAERHNSPEHPITPPKSSQAEETPQEERVSAMEDETPTPMKTDKTGRPNRSADNAYIKAVETPGVTSEWTRYESADEGYLGWSKALVQGHVEMRCDRCWEEKGELFTTRYWQGMGGHARRHGPAGVDAQRRQAAKVRGAVDDAILLLADAIGLDITGGSGESEAEIAKLKKTVADLTAERDELLNWKATVKGLLGN